MPVIFVVLISLLPFLIIWVTNVRCEFLKTFSYSSEWLIFFFLRHFYYQFCFGIIGLSLPRGSKCGEVIFILPRFRPDDEIIYHRRKIRTLFIFALYLSRESSSHGDRRSGPCGTNPICVSRFYLPIDCYLRDKIFVTETRRDDSLARLRSRRRRCKRLVEI